MKENTVNRYPFNLKDWILPMILGVIGSIVLVASLLFLCEEQLADLSKDLSTISVTFAFTLLGFLISAYAILQTVVQSIPDAETIKTMPDSRENKMKRRAKLRILASPMFLTFKGNLLRIAFLSLVFLILCIAFKPLVYLGVRFYLLVVNGVEMFGILFIASSGYTNLKTLFKLI